MKIGSYYSAYAPTTAKPALPPASAALELAFSTIASPITPEAKANKPSAAGSSPLLSEGTNSALLKLQEVKEDENTVEKQFAEMLEGNTPEEMISEISSMSGFMKWQIKELTKKITAEVMGSMGISMEDLKAMPAEQKIAIMQRIMDAVREKLQMAMEEQMKKQNKDGLPLEIANIEPVILG